MRQESDERRCDWLRGGRKVRKDPEVAAMMRAGLILLRKELQSFLILAPLVRNHWIILYKRR